MELLRRLAKEYSKANKKSNSEIISEYCQLTGLSRAGAQKRLRRFVSQASESSSRSATGRKKLYSKAHREVVQCCWVHLGCICAERLHPVLAETIEQLFQQGQLRQSSMEVIQQTKAMSLGSLKRIIRKFPKSAEKKNHKGNAFIYTQVPIQAEY